MKIRQANIEASGRLQDREFQFGSGINLMRGSEEDLTSMKQFVDTMFYGSEEDAEELRGTLWIERRQENLRLTRRFSESNSYHELMSETTGAITDARKGSLKQVLSPISEAIYRRHFSMGNLKNLSDRELARMIQNSYVGYEEGGGNFLDLGRAEQMLKMSRKGYQSQEQRRQKELHQLKKQTEEEASALREEIEQIRTEKKAEAARRKEEEKEQDEAEMGEVLQKERSTARVAAVLAGILSFGCLAAAVLAVSEWWMRLLLILGSFAVAVFGTVFMRKFQEDLVRMRRHRRRQKREKQEQQEEEREKRREQDLIYRDKVTRYRNLRSDALEISRLLSEVTPESEEITAINLAMEKIGELSWEYNQKVHNRLLKRTTEILRELTGNSCREIRADENLKLSVRTDQKVLALEFLDREKLEALFFAVELAADELLYGTNAFFFWISNFHDSYSENVQRALLRFMGSSGRQFILETFDGKEAEFLSSEGIEYQTLELS